MYTIGQIATIMGISRDKLRYYEEKGILNPKQQKDNNYRQYDFNDIDKVLAIEFYRSLNLDFKTIQKLHTQSNINEIQSILEHKLTSVMNEMDRLNAIVNRIKKAKKAVDDVKNYLYHFTIRPMEPIKVLGVISDFRAYNEFDVIHEKKEELDDNSIVNSLKRLITFSDEGILSNKMLVTKEVVQDVDEPELDVLNYEKCVYTIVEDGMQYKNVFNETFMKSMDYIHKNHLIHQGIAIVSMLLIEYDHDCVKTYLEIFIPIE